MAERQYGITPGVAYPVTWNERTLSPIELPVQPSSPQRRPVPSLRSQQFSPHEQVPGLAVPRQATQSLPHQEAPTFAGPQQATPPYLRRSPSPLRRAQPNSAVPTQLAYGMVDTDHDMAGVPPHDGRAQALRDIDNLYGGRMMSPSPEPYQGPFANPGQGPYAHPSTQYLPFQQTPVPRPIHQYTNSGSSIVPLMPPPQYARDPSLSPSTWERNHGNVPGPAGFHNEPVIPAGYPHHGDGYDDSINRNAAAVDDEEWRPDPPPHQQSHEHLTAAAASSAAIGIAGASAGGLMNPFGSTSRDTSGSYIPLSDGAHNHPEKSEWLQQQTQGRKRLKWIIISVIALFILCAVAGGTVGGILASKSKSNGSSGSSSSSPASSGALFDINSPQVKQLLNNKALHKVFPGMDYTPLNAQYPDCLSQQVDQNNVTLDIAMLSQLTPAVRLYGTDCNQTEAVLTAIDKLGYNDTVKVWIGVWLGNNATTNARQLQQMYDVLDKYPSSHFAGVIVGNEVLFRKDMTAQQLGEQLQSVRSNLTAKKIALPVATSDLGDNWTRELAQRVDTLCANVHPLFAGVTPDHAAGWAWNFWQTHDVALLGSGKAAGGWPKNIISEIGWPSSGGNDCGIDANGKVVVCPNAQAGAVASVDNMNTFMSNWVCQSLTNGTTYFWFEAFDEPWKVMYNTPTDQWESKWGLMDSDRNVKAGLKIPDCGGRTVDKPY